MILGMEPKNQVIWTIHCKLIAKYVSSWLALVGHHLHKKNIFINNMTWAIPSLRSEKFRKPEPPEKVSLSENVTFRGFWLSLSHFGQQAP